MGTRSDVEELIASVENPKRRADAEALLELMKRVTGEEPELWGSIIGFGRYHYKYESGREGDAPKVGFSPRKPAITLYVMPGLAGYEDLLSRLGPHTTGKSCVYIKDLEAIDPEVLEELITRAVAHIDELYGG
jgi:hypothetical protein